MANTTLRINQDIFKKKFAEQIDSDPRIKLLVSKFANTIFLRAKNSLLKNFDEHPITEELKEGPSGSNISGTLGGYGNLFAFLGFFDTQQPTEELELLLRNITLRKSTRKGNTVYFTASVPSQNTIESVTQLNWGEGKSWVYAVETGEFDGEADLNHFIYKSFENGRSQQGVQVEGIYREENFMPRPYLTQILNNFRDRINGNNKFN